MRRLNEAFSSGNTGAMPEIVQTVRKLSGQIASVSIQELSEIIEQDPNVTEKVISAANTFGYNPSGSEIGTISQAIHTVGFERIRNLTLSVMLAQNAGKGMDSEAQREMAAVSVCSGMLAQNLVSSSDQFSSDPDIAFVSGSLRNYGKLLMSTFFVDEFMQARELSQQGGGDSGYFETFGMTPLELGHTLLLGTNLPDLIMASLERIPQEKLGRSAESESEEILIAAEFCVQVCELAFNHKIGADDFQQELNALITRFGDSIPLDFETVVNSLEEVDTALGQLNEVIGIKRDRSPANQALRARLNGEALKPNSTKKSDKKPIGIKGVDQPKSLSDLLLSLENGDLKIDSEQLAELYSNVSRAMHDELGLGSCMTFLKDPEETRGQRFSARHGFGPLFDRIKNRPLVSSEKKDLFSICLARKEDILIQDSTAGKIASVIPEWIHDRGEVSSLIVMPATTGAQLFAIFVGVKTDGSAIVVEPATHKRLRQIRNQLSSVVSAL